MTPTPAVTGETLHAVLFDMDGTLLDSEKTWDIGLHELARELGGSLSTGTRAAMVGSNLARTVAMMHDEVGVDGDHAASGQFLLERMTQLFRTDLVWKPGAADLLAAVRDAGVPAALVTSTTRELTEVALDTIGREYFGATVCGDEVVHAKPDADPYLRAARLLGVEPTRCVVIEDSPLGVAAGEAAGCAVLAVPSEVQLTPGPGTVLRDSLVGLSVADLEALLHR